jgi:hypothetical protein
MSLFAVVLISVIPGLMPAVHAPSLNPVPCYGCYYDFQNGEMTSYGCSAGNGGTVCSNTCAAGNCSCQLSGNCFSSLPMTDISPDGSLFTPQSRRARLVASLPAGLSDRRYVLASCGIILARMLNSFDEARLQRHSARLSV